MIRPPARLRVVKDEPAPPYSLEAEESVLGALLREPQAWQEIANVCTAQDFYRPDHRVIFESIGELAGTGKACDLVSVCAHLEQTARLADVGGFAYLGKLAGDTISANLIRQHAWIVRERSQLRRLQTLGPEIDREIAAGATSAQIAARMQPMLEAVRARSEADEAAGWPEPVNILTELSAPELTAEDLPPALAEFPAAFAEATGFDPSLTVSAAIASAAAALSDRFQIVGDSDSAWFQQARLWVLAIARPAAGKSPAQREMLAPLWHIHRTLEEQWRAAKQELPEGEPKPPRPRVVLVDVTIEALSEALRDNPRGLLVANDEFEGWLGSLDAYRRGAVSRDRGEWLRAFDGGPHTIERVQRGSLYVENWGVSILSATTPAALAKLTRELPEDGLLQRFIPVVGRTAGERQKVATLEPLRRRYAETIARLYDATPRAHNGCVPLAFEAQTYFREWLKRTRLAAEAFGSIEPALEAHLAKYPTFLLRIALTFHAVNVVNHQHEGARDPAAFPVPLSTLDAAARFLARARGHAVAVYLNRQGNETYQLARDVGRAILARAWKCLARRELIQMVRPFRAAESEMQDAALRLLVDMGWLRSDEAGYSKPTPARYLVNPIVASRFAQLAERERQRRALVRDAISEAAQERRAGDEA